MSLARTAMRSWLVDTLKGNITSIGSNVYMNRTDDFQPDELPCISIRVDNGTDTTNSNGPMEVSRTCDVEINIVAKIDPSAADIAANLDQLSALVEALIYRDDTFGGRIESFEPRSWALQLPDEKEDGVIALTTNYDCTYRESFPVETFGAVDFEGVDTDVHAVPDDNQKESSISAELET